MVLDLVNLKARYGRSDKIFTELLVLLKKMIPKDNKLLNIHYEVKKILCPISMEYQKIHACLNDWIPKNEFAEMHKCPTCGVSRYKVKDDDYSNDESTQKNHPTKVCCYLPIIPMLK